MPTPSSGTFQQNRWNIDGTGLIEDRGTNGLVTLLDLRSGSQGRLRARKLVIGRQPFATYVCIYNIVIRIPYYNITLVYTPHFSGTEIFWSVREYLVPKFGVELWFTQFWRKARNVPSIGGFSCLPSPHGHSRGVLRSSKTTCFGLVASLTIHDHWSSESAHATFSGSVDRRSAHLSRSLIGSLK